MRTRLAIVPAICCCVALTTGLRAQSQRGQRGQRSELRNQQSAPYTCTLLADSLPVWLWVYQDPEEEADRASVLFAGKLERGGKRSITSGTYRIRYSYKTSENDEMHGDLGAGCYKGNTLRVP